MRLKDYLFDGGDTGKVLVRIAQRVGGGDCVYCAFYRVLIVLAMVAFGWMFGAPYSAVPLGIALVALVVLHRIAKRLPEPNWRDSPGFKHPPSKYDPPKPGEA